MSHDPQTERVFVVEIAAPPARVWDEITRRGSRCRPMFGTVLVSDLVPGSQVRYRRVAGRHPFVAGDVERGPATRVAQAGCGAGAQQCFGRRDIVPPHGEHEGCVAIGVPGIER